MSSLLDSPDGDPGFQIAPMVDVVFVLMLFFMACAGMQITEKELSVNTPAAGGGDVTAIVVAIDEDGAGSINDLPIAFADDHALSKLRSWLIQARREFGDRDLVLIRPEPNVRHERLVDVLNAVSAAGVAKITFG